MTLDVALSALDEARWGVRSARALGVTADNLAQALDFCRAHDVVFLVARCPVSDLRGAQAMEQHGFLLMDTLLYFTRDLTMDTLPSPPLREGGLNRVVVRPARADEAETVGELAARAFAGYNGHYHADTRLDRAACDAVYRDWAVRSCLSQQVADKVLVAEADGRMAGFVTIKKRGDLGEGPLYGVEPAAHGRGIGGALMAAAMMWLKQRGARRMEMSTQVTNVPSQKVWVRLGFEPAHAEYTFHKWFDE
ncbi:MAG: GNAT family N-acetyltransferase [Chloroflexi bacterium]|nr:GNAT family N-acetyltransferase [Chloroflexota bacterium]